MAGEPTLRPVPDPDPDAARNPVESTPSARSAPPGGLPGWAPTALAVALVLSLALLVWSRVQLGAQVTALTDQVHGLEQQLDARNRVISAQNGQLSTAREGLDELSTRVDALRNVLATPLPTVE